MSYFIIISIIIILLSVLVPQEPSDFYLMRLGKTRHDYKLDRMFPQRNIWNKINSEREE
jgi:hypothetical protein